MNDKLIIMNDKAHVIHKLCLNVIHKYEICQRFYELQQCYESTAQLFLMAFSDGVPFWGISNSFW